MANENKELEVQIREVDTLLKAIDGVDKRIEELVSELRKAVEGQLEVIKSLKDENESLWFMLEEIRNSDMENWAKRNNNKDILQHRVDDWFAQMAHMKNNAGDA